MLYYDFHALVSITGVFNEILFFHVVWCEIQLLYFPLLLTVFFLG